MTSDAIRAIKELLKRIEIGGQVPLQDIREELVSIVRDAKNAATNPRETGNFIVIMHVDEFNCGNSTRGREGNENGQRHPSPQPID